MIKKLAKSIREYKKFAILAPLSVVIEVALELSIPLLMAAMIDKGITLGNFDYVWKMGIVLVVLTLISMIFGAISGNFSARASAGFAKNLRGDLFKRIQGFSFSNVDKYSTPSLITRLTTDVTNVQNAFQMMLRMMVRAPLVFLISMIVTFQINSGLAMIFVFVTPVLAIGLGIIIAKAHPIFERVFQKYDDLNTVVQENIRGMRVVKSFVREDYEKEKFSSGSEKIYRNFVKAEKILAFNNPLMQLCVYTCMILISWLGANYIVAGNMTTGELMSLFVYTMKLLVSLMMVSGIFVMIIISRASVKRISEILDEESDLTNPDNPLFQVADGSITFENVNFSYGGAEDSLSLEGINLNIKSGETIGIIGGTGSAKTTLVHLIPRLYDVTSGKVSVGGVDVREYDIKTLRNQVAMVLQNNQLFSGTVNENLRWGNPNATEEEIIKACEMAQAADFVERMPKKYETYIEQGGSNVSGGQKQRLCIARALLKNPKILILDDSTSAVDTKTDALIRKSFADYIPGVTKLIIAQRIASIQDSDQIIVLDEGKISGVGTHEQLLESNNIYQEVYNSQMRGGVISE